MRDIGIIDSELRSVAALRRAARERGGPLPSIAVADALLDERLRADGVRLQPAGRVASSDTEPGLRLLAVPCFAAETYAIPNAFTGSAEKCG
jgi:hypothetical protein